ncbi:hypothetical protein [Staphylococcus intermedius]|nr:hypothetical protein [Staphylococcus intermedius]PCF65640.1 hypothetical protein B5C04_06190 [Staphylococcus intermedius]PCF81319.1 hypothetical protein B4W74_06540 [Staphylococcus intermedius]PCF82601.1 hypothetical protein B4W70_06180 [Staphylococcus intermedius]PCF87301.1 hypothetical protein B4W75_09455 [Staphylococcus intermedius]PNZ53981.1 hypothetical protein CD138_03565 [Staphylococcus intermedius NCTC 11048]
MHFSTEDVQHYLALVNDTNPIHTDIVPGQLVVQRICVKAAVEPIAVRYKNPIVVDEQVTWYRDNMQIQVFGMDEQLKLVIEVKET